MGCGCWLFPACAILVSAAAIGPSYTLISSLAAFVRRLSEFPMRALSFSHRLNSK